MIVTGPTRKLPESSICRGFTAVSGFSLVETVISVLLVSVLFTAAINTYGAAKVSHTKAAEQVRGQVLAAGLMNEIMDVAYDDPDQTPIFGIEASEMAGSTTRANFDDVDDFQTYTDDPISDRNGTIVPSLSGWKRTINVVYVAPATQDTGEVVFAAVGSDQGFKKVTVTVYYNNRQTAQLVALRCAAR